MRHEIEENGELVQFIYSGSEVVAETDKDNRLTRYIRGYELISADSDKARTYYHYCNDELGSITHILDEEGNILNRYEYDAFGNTVMCEESVSNRFRFTGQQYDSITEQYYLRARYYNPVIGRFIQEDTYYGDGLNLYAYCENNPVRYVDPSGYTKVDAFEKPGGDQQVHSTGNEPKRMTWNEFQHANKGKYTKAEMSAAWADYKRSFAQSVPNSTPSQGSNNPYDLLKKRGIHTTLSDAEIDAANAVDLRMQAQGGSETRPTRRQSFREAKEAADIPKSAQPDTHAYVYDGTSENRTVYEFTVDGQKKYVILHTEDKMGRGPHFHGADDAKGNPFDKGRYNQYPGHYPEDFDGFE